jgi:hypothetical protein
MNGSNASKLALCEAARRHCRPLARIERSNE